jgi:N-acetylglucosaminyl-diphospho-decaprenol L-rhamnosyltransferase
VIDNASQDRTVERARDGGADVIENAANLGFAGAVNQGVRRSDTELILLLNPDVALRTDIAYLLSTVRENGLGAGKLLDQNGESQRGFTIRRFPTPLALMFETLGVNRLWPTNWVNRNYRYLDRDLDRPGTVEQPAGAFLGFRRDVWEKLGGFDERFWPVWFEDVDFCKRAVTAGFRIEYVPEVQAIHQGGHSVSQLSSGCRAVYWCDSLLKYAAKYFSSWEYRGICLTIILGSLPRLIAGLLGERNFAPASTWLTIIRLAVRRWVAPVGIRVSPKQT